MPRLNTLKDLMQAGELTVGEVRRLAKIVFNGGTPIPQTIVPYRVTIPLFDALPDHVQQFIIKAILEAKVVNILEDSTPEEIKDLVAELGDDSVLVEQDPDEGSMYGIAREQQDDQAHYASFGPDGDE